MRAIDKIAIRMDEYGLPITCLSCGEVCSKQYERLDKGKLADYCCFCILFRRSDLITKPEDEWVCTTCERRWQLYREGNSDSGERR